MKITTLFFALVLVSNFLTAQSDEENLERYWKYRDRLITEFMKVDALQGGSIPMSTIVRRTTNPLRRICYPA